jgi:hypothetical protein
VGEICIYSSFSSSVFSSLSYSLGEEASTLSSRAYASNKKSMSEEFSEDKISLHMKGKRIYFFWSYSSGE